MNSSLRRPAAAHAAVGAGLLTLLGCAALAPRSLPIVLLDGGVALSILAAATGFGLICIRLLGVGRMQIADRLALAAALGVGALPLVVLCLGSAGWLGRPLWIGVVAVLAALGGLELMGFAGGVVRHQAGRMGRRRGSWLWLLATPFLALALVAAALPPGVLWPAEGNGYDVLEYHLAAPREWLLAGRITHLPHNIYADFPFAAEMHYLLGMILHGEPLAAVYTAQYLHVGMGAIAVAAVMFAARPLGRRAAIIAGVVAATCPMLTYLSPLAYTENGLLALTAAALGCVIRAGRARLDDPGSVSPNGLAQTEAFPSRDREGAVLHPTLLNRLPTRAARIQVTRRFRDTALRWCTAAGCCAGLACGFKYTAVPMILLPLAAAVALRPTLAVALRSIAARVKDSGAAATRRFAGLACFLPAAALCFSPWLIRNALATGNPFFPLARSFFYERPGVWSDELAARWQEGHLPDPRERNPAARLSVLGREVLHSRLFGVTPWLPLLGLLVVGSPRRPRGVLAPVLILLLGVLTTWLFATHLVGRFAVPLIAPLAVLTAMAGRGPGARRAAGAAGRSAALIAWIVVPAAAANFAGLTHLAWRTPLRFAHELAGRTDWMTTGQWPEYGWLGRINERLAAGQRVLLIAEARTLYVDAPPDCYTYCVVFNRSPFAEAAARLSPAELIGWLREQRYDCVFVHWGEMRRLRNSRYGFWPGVDEALFARLVAAGLRVAEEFRYPDPPESHYATLFEVTRR